jgi:hypothetical protein
VYRKSKSYLFISLDGGRHLYLLALGYNGDTTIKVSLSSIIIKGGLIMLYKITTVVLVAQTLTNMRALFRHGKTKYVTKVFMTLYEG